ncbi:hypothetical protein KQX54_016559 [Cotesia glomerata]|uniref:Uncharacterized protein n=1 Tax=Cotesia glomerata TaxID=32391 RepID=A0AAV7HKG4_COTGL|nr:hypothetical protein KQX54_016559 [Cotesia glomerata]
MSATSPVIVAPGRCSRPRDTPGSTIINFKNNHTDSSTVLRLPPLLGPCHSYYWLITSLKSSILFKLLNNKNYHEVQLLTYLNCIRYDSECLRTSKSRACVISLKDRTAHTMDYHGKIRRQHLHRKKITTYTKQSSL